MTVVPPAPVARDASAVVPPTGPAKVIAPLDSIASDCAPSKVPAKVTEPAPVVTVVAEPNEVAPSVSAAFVVLTAPLIVTRDGAVAVSPLANEAVPRAWPIVSVPVFAKVAAPDTPMLAPPSVTSKAFGAAETVAAPKIPFTATLPPVLLKFNAPTPSTEENVSTPDPAIDSA